MSKLKTLKDLEHIEDLKHQDSKLVYSWKLRQEAIKWHKQLGNNSRDNSVKWFLEHFFNLTEEDLK